MNKAQRASPWCKHVHNADSPCVPPCQSIQHPVRISSLTVPPQSPHPPSSATPLLRKRSIPQPVPRHNEQTKDHADPTQKHPRPRVRNRHTLVIDIDKIIHHPTRHIPPTERIQPPVIHAGHVPRDDGRGEEADVLEAVLLGAFGADDAVLGGLVERLVVGDFGRQRARLRQVEGFGRFGVVQLRRVHVRRETEDPGCGDGVEGEVPRQVEEGCHAWVG